MSDSTESNSTEMEELADSIFQAVQKYVDDRLAAELGPLVQINEGLSERLEAAERYIAGMKARWG